MKNLFVEEKINKLRNYIEEGNIDDSSDIIFKMYYSMENLRFQDNDGMDIRLFQKGYLEHAVTFESITKSTNKIIGYTTIYIVPKEIYRNDFLWIYDSEKNVLRKKYLKDWEEEIGEYILITAYSHTGIAGKIYENNYYKWQNAKRYIDILSIMANDIPVYEEVMGTYNCKAPLLEKLELNEKDVGGFQSLKEVDEHSKASLQFAALMKLQRVPNAFHSITLGPIYCGYLHGKKDIIYT